MDQKNRHEAVDNTEIQDYVEQTLRIDSGFEAWSQVMGSFFLFFNSWGIINTFGTFQTFYETKDLQKESPSSISWIGSTQSFLLLLIGVFTGPLYDAGYFRALIVVGSIMISLGFMMTSICSEYWQFLLAQAFCIGLGTGFLYIPSLALLPQYFKDKKAIATGIATSGSSFGGVVYPIMFRSLVNRIGFGWTTRVLGFLVLATTSISIFIMHPRQKGTREIRHLFDIQCFKHKPYMFFCIAMFFGYVGFFGPIFYIQSYAIQQTRTDENLAFYLLAVLNAASIPGRILPAYFASKIGYLNMLIPTAAAMGILNLCWPAIRTFGGLVAFSVLYGVFSGAFVSLPAVALASLSPDQTKLGIRLGMCSVVCAFGSLCGTPVCGAILNTTNNWLGVQLFSGFASLLACLHLLLARHAQVGLSLYRKV